VSAELHDAYRLFALQAVLHEQRLTRAFALLRAAGVEAILGKGWAVARLYPDLGLRPYGDIDLYVRHHQHVGTAPRRPGTRPLPVGLVAVSQYRQGARWRPRRLTPGQGVLALLANAVPARERPAAALAALQRAVVAAPVLKGTRGEASEVAGVLLENVG
jgi:hypothetical protein